MMPMLNLPVLLAAALAIGVVPGIVLAHDLQQLFVDLGKCATSQLQSPPG